MTNVFKIAGQSISKVIGGTSSNTRKSKSKKPKKITKVQWNKYVKPAIKKAKAKSYKAGAKKKKYY